jgi:hypothetical protein
VTSIDRRKRRVITDESSYDADVLVVALGAAYDMAATPGFEEGRFEYYSLAGAERMHDMLPTFDSGTIVIGILGHPFKCPPAPFEGALLLHDHLVGRGIREGAASRGSDPRLQTGLQRNATVLGSNLAPASALGPKAASHKQAGGNLKREETR